MNAQDGTSLQNQFLRVAWRKAQPLHSDLLPREVILVCCPLLDPLLLSTSNLKANLYPAVTILSWPWLLLCCSWSHRHWTPIHSLLALSYGSYSAQRRSICEWSCVWHTSISRYSSNFSYSGFTWWSAHADLSCWDGGGGSWQTVSLTDGDSNNNLQGKLEAVAWISLLCTATLHLDDVLYVWETYNSPMALYSLSIVPWSEQDKRYLLKSELVWFDLLLATERFIQCSQMSFDSCKSHIAQHGHLLRIKACVEIMPHNMELQWDPSLEKPR